jgi:FKBP-type peptidyl-prolyl cis-trans isomerase
MRLWRVGIVSGLVGLAASGCGEPSVIEVAPPGANIPRVSPDSEPATAQGEMAGVPASPPGAATEFKPAVSTAKGQTKTTPGGVTYETLKEGSGPELQRGQKAQVHYVGTNEKGEVFDSSRTRNEPLDIQIGKSPLIKGWEESIPGMKVGEIRKLIIPPALAYGDAGKPPKVPPNATLIFEVELLNIVPEQ